MLSSGAGRCDYGRFYHAITIILQQEESEQMQVELVDLDLSTVHLLIHWAYISLILVMTRAVHKLCQCFQAAKYIQSGFGNCLTFSLLEDSTSGSHCWFMFSLMTVMELFYTLGIVYTHVQACAHTHTQTERVKQITYSFTIYIVVQILKYLWSPYVV
jgi:hypothetical protein